MSGSVREEIDHGAGAEVDLLRRRLDEVGLLGRVAVAANEARDVAEALDEGLSQLGRHARCVAATVWLSGGRTRPLEPSRRWFRTARASPSLVRAVDDGDPVALGSLPGRVEASGAPVWLVGLDGRSHWLGGADDARLGVAAAFGVPLWVGGEHCGVLAGFYAEERPVDAHLLELVEQVATQLAVAFRRLARPEPGPSWLLGSSSIDAAAIAHRVRTPLIGVLTPLELLHEAEEDPQRRELLEVALAAAQELHGLIEAALRGPAPVGARPPATVSRRPPSGTPRPARS